VTTPRRSDRRRFAIGLTVAVVAIGGWALQRWNRDEAPSSSTHAEEQLKAEVDTRFQQGVVMLHAKEYSHAMTAFHRVLQLAPTLPEAHVNIGFALLGLRRYPEARAFFESATDLRPQQTNAYYGMAVALEGMNDLPGALGAMESYLHLAKADDPYRRKAEAAIWEWRAAMPAKPMPAKPIPAAAKPH
jgi:tetratricopeptide (TPR) repeat protein